jgi:DnaJ-class molecular chaperone
VCWHKKRTCFEAIVEALHLGGSDDPYAVLGLYDDAPMKYVRSAFRQKAKHVHPDKCAKPECARKFRVRAKTACPALQSWKCRTARESPVPHVQHPSLLL